MKKRILAGAGIVIIILALVYTWYTKNSSKKPTAIGMPQKLQVTASFYPLFYFASEIGKGKATVKNITPAGSEPHDYEPSARDIAQIEKSNLLVLNGGFEAWGDKIKENLKETTVRIVIAGEGIFTQQLTENGKTQTDPHIWLSPILVKKEVEAILDGFVSEDSLNKDYYSKGANQLLARLDDLDAKYKEGLRLCKQKDLITSHAAFGYLASSYGLNQVPISGLSPNAEPSSQQLASVANFARDHKINYIFFEKLVSRKLAETIATEIGAKTLVLDPLEGLADDEIKVGKNYFTVMEDNLKNLELALQCGK